ncbi:MAG: hypothetical protein AB8B55_17515 [Mariniblastus sp.]
MKFCTWALLVFASTLFFNTVSAQTLTEKLLAESPAKLVEESRSYGNIVRGAILFHQGNINCAKCHRASAQSDLIGPALNQMAEKVTDEYIIESILKPSEKIKEGYGSVIATTADGKVITGLKVSEDDKKIVIRDSQNIDQLITVLREDIDDVRPSKLSSMPAKLADELKDRQQFLDLVRYVLDLKERGPDANVATAKANAPRRELSPELTGLVLIKKNNCVACHKSNSSEIANGAKKPPRLKWSAKWLDPNYIQSYVANPHAVKPGTTMPELLGSVDESTRKTVATSITHFLVASGKNEFATESIDTAAVPRGHELFHSIGCVACHSPRDETATEQPISDSTPLGNLANKYNVSGLVNFLEDPQAVRASGHMPNMRLTHREAIDISSFLLQSAQPAKKWGVNEKLAEQGKSLFTKHNCASCHTEFLDASKTKPQLASDVALEKLTPTEGCLSSKTGQWPNFHLESNEIKSIQAALKKAPNRLTDTQKIETSLALFNCIACHSRDSLGGINVDRNPHFKTTNLNLGDQGRIPPTLTGVGAKLNPKWMRDVMVNQRSIRPYMKTRMPQYGEENIAHLIELFQSNDKIGETKFAEFTDQKKMRETGLELAGNKGLNCVACHTYQYKISDTMPAVDLTEMTERLKKDWFYQYMLAPQAFSPNTVMPSFWPDGKAIRQDIEGPPDQQIEAIWQYLLDGRQARAPRGVIREPLEIVVANEARMLRRSYQDIGKRGIGVGYPGGINLTFDAEQLRLNSIWKGKFLDPAGVFYGQGSGTARPMSRPFKFIKGPELDDKNEPWIVDDGRPPKHQFKGYSLDKSQRPTFRYVFDSVEVKDFFLQAKRKASQKTILRRVVKLVSKTQRDNLKFRIGSAKDISVVDESNFTLDKQLQIRLVSQHAATVEKSGDGKQLEISLSLSPDTQQTLVIEYLLE